MLGTRFKTECRGVSCWAATEYEDPADYTLFFQADAADHMHWGFSVAMCKFQGLRLWGQQLRHTSLSIGLTLPASQITMNCRPGEMSERMLTAHEDVNEGTLHACRHGVHASVLVVGRIKKGNIIHMLSQYSLPPYPLLTPA